MTLSYEMCAKLRENGYPQAGRFWWVIESESGDPKLVGTGEFRLSYSGDEFYEGYDNKYMVFKKVICPTLSELIEACGDRFFELKKMDKNYYCTADNGNGGLIVSGYFNTPEEAVCNLYLELNKS